jgi:hypothetical protein
MLLVLTRLAPHDEPHAGSSSIAKRHRQAGLGFHADEGRVPTASLKPVHINDPVRMIGRARVGNVKNNDPSLIEPISAA